MSHRLHRRRRRADQGLHYHALEQEIATAEDIDYITSSSSRGFSTITAHVRTGANPDEVLTQVVTKVNKLRNELPPTVGEPGDHPRRWRAGGQHVHLLHQ